MKKCWNLIIAFLMVFLASYVFAETIDRADLERATREVDRPLVRDDYMPAVRKKPVIRDEKGKIIREEDADEKYDRDLEDVQLYPAYR
jgi:hypothetical protein